MAAEKTWLRAFANNLCYELRYFYTDAQGIHFQCTDFVCGMCGKIESLDLNMWGRWSQVLDLLQGWQLGWATTISGTALPRLVCPGCKEAYEVACAF